MNQRFRNEIFEMKMVNIKIFGLLLLTGFSLAQYEPTWESLDSRPLPAWYDEAKIGIFIHWGVFSVPSFGSEWFWANWKGLNADYVKFMKDNYPPKFTYQDFGREFTAEFYKPQDWADIFNASGARYVVLTSKHHEGYTLWPSKYSFSWNSKDLGPNRDLLGELATALRNKTDLKFGLYHSLYEWYNPLYKLDKKNKFKTQYFVNQKTIPELHELIQDYQPEIIWSDGDWEASDTYWTSKEFLAWLYNESPVKNTVVVNDRWGSDIPCHHGDFYTCQDRYNPGVLQPHKWESCITIDKDSWGYRRNARLADYLTTDQLVEKLTETVSCGGNFLMNVGPTKDGMIPTIFEERLRDIGKWLKVNGEAIYQSKPWKAQNDTVTKGVWYTMRGSASSDNFVYAIVFDWPSTKSITLGVPVLSDKSEITMLGVEGILKWSQSTAELTVTFPDKATVATDWAWTLKMTNVVGTRNASYVNLINNEPQVISLDSIF